MDKSETIAKLYALRAGISYLSMMRKETYEDESKIRAYEKAVLKEEKIKEQVYSCVGLYCDFEEISKSLPKIDEGDEDDWDEDVSDMFVKVRQAKRDINIVDGHKMNWRRHIEDDIEKKEREIQREEVAIEHNERKKKIFKALAIVFACIVAVIEILSLVFFRQLNGAGTVIMVDSMIGGLIIIGIFLANSSGCKSKVAKSKKRIEEIKADINTCQIKDDLREQKKAEALKTLQDITAEIDALKESVNQTLKEISYPTKRIYSNMKDKFSEVLYEDDWKYLDYIIYEIGSGRSDSVRDTLQKIDMLSQSRSLESCIGQARENVKKMIAEMRPETRESVLNACEDLCLEKTTDPGVELKNPGEHNQIETGWRDDLKARDFFDCFEECSACGAFEMMVDVKELKENF